MKQAIEITGMTCENCARHVKEALEGLPGVQNVNVDLAHHSAHFDAERAIDREKIAAVLDEAGYALA
uniref:Mercuric reductase (Hg(II) reductase) n=1 Tax=mine drainage metagenome TaxID=410659 RepID=E6Q644_9ZZZZ